VALKFQIIRFSIDIPPCFQKVLLGIATERAAKIKEIVRFAGELGQPRGKKMYILEIKV
jgi:hypothetical protein